MKKVVSISIGSSKRDHVVDVELLGEQFHIWREGTDGDMPDAARRLREYDGKVDAFGMGGIDLFLNAADRTYWFRDAKQFRDAVKTTPLLDGSGLKGAVEGDVVRFMQEDLGLQVAGKRVLVTSAVDRWGMAMAFADAGCEMTYGDLLYALDVPIMIHTKPALIRAVRVMAPIASQLPFKFLYPAEADHTSKVESESKHAQLYRDADIISGDYKFVRKYMPQDMTGQVDRHEHDHHRGRRVPALHRRRAAHHLDPAPRGPHLRHERDRGRRSWRSRGPRRRSHPSATSSSCVPPASPPTSSGCRRADPAPGDSCRRPSDRPAPTRREWRFRHA